MGTGCTDVNNMCNIASKKAFFTKHSYLYMLQSAFSRFRLVAFLEGCSYLLFAITMPLKYKLNMPGPTILWGWRMVYCLYYTLFCWYR